MEILRGTLLPEQRVLLVGEDLVRTRTATAARRLSSVPPSEPPELSDQPLAQARPLILEQRVCDPDPERPKNSPNSSRIPRFRHNYRVLLFQPTVRFCLWS